jgi:hypothetical protein
MQGRWMTRRLSDRTPSGYGQRVERPLLILNPRYDDRFVGRVQYLMASGADSPERLQELLRGQFPTAIVRPRALSGEPQRVWYVYRDGRWVNGAED